MHYLVPHFILEQTENAGTFPAYTLFVDISGFTNMTETLMVHGQHGAEVMHGVVTPIFATIINTIYEQGGFVAIMAGDAVTAIFSAEKPAARARALAAGWNIQRQMQTQNTFETRYGQFDIAVKVGLGQGKVDWGILTASESERRTFYFRGAGIQACSDAEKQAERGDFVLSAAVYADDAGIQVIPTNEHHSHYRVQDITLVLPEPVEVPPTKPEHFALVARYYPRNVVGANFVGEFRQALGVFISLPGMPAISEITIFMQQVFSLQKIYGGFLNRIDFGDKGCHMLLFWGAPFAYENDIERALNFALTLRQQSNLPLRMGITYRITHAGFSGASLREEYTCFGRGINLAARLMMGAEVGDIWLDEPTNRRAMQHFVTTSLGEKSFKGFNDPLPVFNLESIRESQTMPQFTQPLIGRDEELAQLSEWFQPIMQGKNGGLILLEGEAGFGKSHLLAELRTQQVKTVRWFIGASDEIIRSPLNPFRYWLRRYFNQSPQAGEAENKVNFANKMAQLATDITNDSQRQFIDELQRLQSFLGAMIDLHWADSLYEQLEPDLRFENSLEAVKTLLKVESLLQPVVLQIEDAQWLDDSSRTLIESLRRQVSDFPFLILVAQRPQVNLADFQPDHTLILQRLSNEQVAQFVNSFLKTAAAPALVKLVIGRVQGNPYFAEQLLIVMQSRNLLIDSEQGVTYQIGHTESLLPTDVRAVLMARLDALTKEVVQVVQTAAVLGREFAVDLLEKILARAELPEAVTAENEGIWQSLSALRYLFRQSLLRDAAYDMQLRARLRELHGVAGFAIETLYAGNLDPHYRELAHHFYEGENKPKALVYSMQAGQQAVAEYANEEAIVYFNRALTLVDEADLLLRVDLLLAREGALNWLGKREAQKADLDLLEVLGRGVSNAGILAKIALRHATYYYTTTHYQEAITAIKNAIVQAQRADDVPTEAESHYLWGQILRRTSNHDDARTHTEKALALSRSIQDSRGEARALTQLGNLFYNHGQLDQGVDLFRQASAKFSASNDLRGQAGAMMMLGACEKDRGNYQKGLDNYLEALELCRQIGYRYGESFLLGNLGVLFCDLGQYKMAETYQEMALNLSEEMDDREGKGFALSNLTLINYFTEQYAEAQQYAHEALQVHAEIEDSRSAAYTNTYLGHILLAVGEVDLAETAYQTGLDIRQASQSENSAVDNLAGLAQVAYQRGELTAALDLAEKAWSRIQDNGVDGVEYPLQVLRDCYRIFKNDEVRAETVLSIRNTAKTYLQNQAKVINDPELRQSFLTNVPFNQWWLSN